MGDDLFYKGLSMYYEKYRNGNAITMDFEKVMENVYKNDLSAFFKQWLYIAGQPELKVTTRTGKKNGTTDIVIEQMQNSLFSFELDLKVTDQKGEELIRIPVSEKTTIRNIEAEKISRIIPDPDVNLLFRISPGSQPTVQAQ
jgi:aminopeptidase N